MDINEIAQRMNERLNIFMATYERQLLVSMRAFPDDYAYGIGDVPKVLERMRLAVWRGSFNKHSPAFERTCKELGIKHTYKAIREFLNG